VKNAYEKALDRFGPIKELPPEKKAKLAELDRLYQSRIAQLEVQFGDKLRQAAPDADTDKLRDQMRREIAKLREKAERERDRVRNG
jgi:hypothetical protein